MVGARTFRSATFADSQVLTDKVRLRNFADVPILPPTWRKRQFVGDQGSTGAWSTPRFFRATCCSGLAVYRRRLAQEGKNSFEDSFDHLSARRKPSQILFKNPRRVGFLLSDPWIHGRVHTCPQSTHVFRRPVEKSLAGLQEISERACPGAL